MCGICGIFFPAEQSSRTPDRGILESMIAALRQRGPDGTDIYLDTSVGLASSRLAILDLSNRGDQPMVVDGGDYAITFNGEIYNYLELRKDLEQSGVTFSSDSDTEVLLRLYIKHGVSCLDALRGMFAFAIWDRKQKKLFLARDRVGEKPLFYYYRNGMFAFASEIKSLLKIPEVPREISPIGLHYGLHYVTIPPPYSPFKHIHKLRPSEYMIVSNEGITCEKYWKPWTRNVSKITDRHEAAFEVRQCLENTVKIMCRSDVPIAATLSGGLDSSSIVAMMSRNSIPFETYCVSYDNPERDPEFAAARLVATYCNTTHHELTYDNSHLASAAEFIKCFDEPFGTFVPLHAFALSKLIGSRVKVALSGSGGDELFGGYADHRILYELDKNLPSWNAMGKAGIDWIAENSPNPSFKPFWQKFRNVVGLSNSRVLAEFRWLEVQKLCSEIYTPQMNREIGCNDPLALLMESYEECQSKNLFDGFMFQQLFVGSHHSLVHLPDIIGMAHSLEYRSPFLDREMIELAMRIPAEMKVDLHRGDAGGKMVLRDACKNLLPHEILTMPKLPFGSQIPYHTWMVGSWADYIKTRLGSCKLTDTGLFNTELLVARHERACRNGAPQMELDMLWGVAMISQWLEEFF